MSQKLGYIGGLRQTGLRVSFGFAAPRDVSWKHIDQILVDYFQVPRAWLSDESWGETGPDVPHSVRHFATCGLVLYQVLGSAAHLPIFEPGRLVKLESVPDQHDLWSVEAVVPFIDGISDDVIPDLLQASFSLVVQLSRAPLDPDAMRLIYEQIDTHVIKRVKEMPGAKPNFHFCRAAFDADVPFRHLGGGLLQLGWGKNAIVAHGSVSLRDSAIGARLCKDKDSCASFLRRLGLPSPSHEVVTTRQEAQKAAQRLGWPVVVKPVDGDRGEGVTTDVTDLALLNDAFDRARKRSRAVLIEQQVAGVCYRVLVVGGQVVYVQKRLPQSIRGDGSHTVAELVKSANAAQRLLPPWQRGKPVPQDDIATMCLKKAGLEWTSVPSAGRLVALRPIESTEWGGIDEDATASIHPENVRISLEASKLFGLHVAGVDMITQDISKPWYDTGAIINEVNFAPQVTLRAPAWLGGSMDTAMHHGRFPIWVILGNGDLLTEARRLTSEWRASGLNGYITSSTATETLDGTRVVLALEGLFDRCLAIMAKPDAEALMAVLDTDEFSHSGLPFDRINRIFIHEADANPQFHDVETSWPHVELLKLCRQYSISFEGN